MEVRLQTNKQVERVLENTFAVRAEKETKFFLAQMNDVLVAVPSQSGQGEYAAVTFYNLFSRPVGCVPSNSKTAMRLNRIRGMVGIFKVVGLLGDWLIIEFITH